jgi:hypothetical protein
MHLADSSIAKEASDPLQELELLYLCPRWEFEIVLYYYWQWHGHGHSPSLPMLFFTNVPAAYGLKTEG